MARPARKPKVKKPPVIVKVITDNTTRGEDEWVLMTGFDKIIQAIKTTGRRVHMADDNYNYFIAEGIMELRDKMQKSVYDMDRYIDKWKAQDAKISRRTRSENDNEVV